MKSSIVSKCFGLSLLVLIVIDPFTTFSQIGYKYKKWIKNKEYLVANGSQPWEKNLTLHSFKAIGKSFSSVGYMEHSQTGKITQIDYWFPTSYASTIYEYCSKYGYCINMENTIFNNEDPIFENVEGTIQYKIQGYTLFEKHPERVKEILLLISTNTHYFKGTFGFE